MHQLLQVRRDRHAQHHADEDAEHADQAALHHEHGQDAAGRGTEGDRKSTRLNSSH